MKNRILSFLMFSFLICALLVTSVSAKTNPPRLVDEADLLSKTDEAEILNRLNEISEKYNYDIVIVTQSSIGNYTAERYADDYFDSNGYGMGNNRDGILLLCTFDDEGRIWHISTSGDAISAFSDSYIDAIFETIRSKVGEDDYKNAFNAFIDECDYYIDGHINGFPFDTGMNLVISIVVGFIIAFIAVSIMKGKLKSVAFQRDAATYVKQGSMDVTVARDFFLYSTITRTAKPKNNGSSTHRSSSGRSHGGGSARF